MRGACRRRMHCAQGHCPVTFPDIPRLFAGGVEVLIILAGLRRTFKVANLMEIAL